MGAQRRKTVRRHVSQPALMVRTDGSVISECTMLDVSAGGARLELRGEVTVPDDFVLMLSMYDGRIRRRCAVSWRKERQVGVRFPDVPPAKAV